MKRICRSRSTEGGLFFHQRSNLSAEQRRTAYLSFLTLGVVFGDIGTSPLYALPLSLSPLGHLPTQVEVLGILSLVIWSLILVICFKYQSFVLRADNNGEGGILALMALLRGRGARPGVERIPVGGDRRKRLVKTGVWVLILGTFGACLIYGDGMITPAISVLSAVQGLGPSFHSVILPITCAILVMLFWFQHRGTEGVSMIFSPLMCLWFAVLALSGAISVFKTPVILEAFNPGYAVFFFMHHELEGFIALGSVFLAVTGGEVLYADIGHFGAAPVRLAWFLVAFPALLLNYLGQGGMILRNPASASSTVFGLVPQSLHYPMVALATIATVIASQATISGSFSLISQSVALNMSPRMKIFRTSKTERGQVYVPFVNMILMLSTIILVLSFGSSSALGGAYGIAISTTMLITTCLMYLVMRRLWHWRWWKSVLLTAIFLVIDIPFWTANMLKIGQGGWVPLAVALLAFAIMRIWTKNRQRLISTLRSRTESLPIVLDRLRYNMPHRVPGTGVFLTSPGLGSPPMLNHHIKRNGTLHEQVLLLSVITTDEPYVMASQRAESQPLGYGFYQIRLNYGFKQTPRVMDSLKRVADRGLINLNPSAMTFYFGRETLVPGSYISPLVQLLNWIRRATNRVAGRPARPASEVARSTFFQSISERIFVLMHSNSVRATDFLQIPDELTVEMGMRLKAKALVEYGD